LANTIPVTPPTVNKNTNPKTHKIKGSEITVLTGAPTKVAIQLKTLIPVGIAIIIVAEVK
jgi:hypothetical protein